MWANSPTAPDHSASQCRGYKWSLFWRNTTCSWHSDDTTSHTLTCTARRSSWECSWLHWVDHSLRTIERTCLFRWWFVAELWWLWSWSLWLSWWISRCDTHSEPPVHHNSPNYPNMCMCNRPERPAHSPSCHNNKDFFIIIWIITSSSHHRSFNKKNQLDSWFVIVFLSKL